MHVNNFLLLYFGKSLVHRLPSIEHQSILVQDHFNVQSKKDSASITNKPTLTLRKTCSYSAFFWSLFSRYGPEKLRNGHFLRNAIHGEIIANNEFLFPFHQYNYFQSNPVLAAHHPHIYALIFQNNNAANTAIAAFIEAI